MKLPHIWNLPFVKVSMYLPLCMPHRACLSLVLCYSRQRRMVVVNRRRFDHSQWVNDDGNAILVKLQLMWEINPGYLHLSLLQPAQTYFHHTLYDDNDGEVMMTTMIMMTRTSWRHWANLGAGWYLSTVCIKCQRALVTLYLHRSFIRPRCSE